jgi:hypothetical protein
LPTSEETTWTRWDTVTYPGGLPFNSRVPDGVEYDAIDTYVLAPMAEQIENIMMESFGTAYTNCEGMTHNRTTHTHRTRMHAC